MIMGHHNQRRCCLVTVSPESVHDVIAVVRVQIPRRFVAQEDGRPRHQSTTDRDALSLALRQVAGIPPLLVAESHVLDQRFRTLRA